MQANTQACGRTLEKIKCGLRKLVLNLQEGDLSKHLLHQTKVQNIQTKESDVNKMLEEAVMLHLKRLVVLGS